jgi:hypothetical protein
MEMTRDCYFSVGEAALMLAKKIHGQGMPIDLDKV